MFNRLLFGLCALTSIVSGDSFLYFSPEKISTHLNGYNEAEKAAIDKDLSVVRNICLGNAVGSENHTPLYLATAGGPGSRKTTILENFIAIHPELAGSVYLDPDARALRFMAHTYYEQSLNYRVIAAFNNYDAVLNAAYEKWRGGSNYITLTLMEEAFRQKLNVIHGTTSTGNHLDTFYPALKNAGYRIELLLCSCDDLVRIDALEYRNKEVRFTQSTPEDAIEKAKRFSEKMPTFFKYADKLYFYWSSGLFQREQLAAVLSRNTFEVLDFEAYVQFVGKYEIDRQKHLLEGTNLPSFKELLIMRTGKSE